MSQVQLSVPVCLSVWAAELDVIYRIGSRISIKGDMKDKNSRSRYVVRITIT